MFLSQRYHIKWSVTCNEAFGQATFKNQSDREEYIRAIKEIFPSEDIWIKIWEEI